MEANVFVYLLLFHAFGLMTSSVTAQNFIYAKGLKNSEPFGGSVGGTSIKVDNLGYTYVTGYFTGTADFDPGTGVTNLSSHTSDNSDIFIAKYDAAGNLVFARSMGGRGSSSGNAIAVDASGNMYVTGNFWLDCDLDPGAGVANVISNTFSIDIFVAKYDASGNYVYAIAMGGIRSDYGRDINVDILGNAYVTGSFSDTADFNPGIGVTSLVGNSYNDAMFIAKYDPLGNYVFAKGIGDETNGVQCNSLALDIAGNAYVTGGHFGIVDFDPGAGVANLSTPGIFIAKYDASGNYVYAKAISGAGYAGNTRIDVDMSGNVCVTGSFSETIDFDPGLLEANLTSAGSQDIFIAKYSASGNYVYAKSVGGLYDDISFGIDIDAFGNANIIGYFIATVDFDPGEGSSNLTADGFSRDIFVASYNASGNYVYAKAMSGSGEDYPYDLTVDGSGKVYLTGVFMGTTDFDPAAGTANLTVGGTAGNAFVSCLTNAGSYAWASQIGTYIDTRLEDQGSDIAVDALGNNFITGYFSGTVDFNPGAGIANLTSAGSYDIFVAKYDASGNYVFAISMGGMNADKGKGIAIDGSGSLYVTGSFANTVDFNPGPGIANLTSNGYNSDIFLAKYDALGNYLYAKAIGGTGTDVANDIASDALGNVYVTGTYYETVDFDPGVGVANLNNAGGLDVFVARYDPYGNYVYASQIGFSNDDASKSIAVDGSGNAFVTGSLKVGSYGTPVYYIFLAKFNPSGSNMYIINLRGTVSSNQAFGIAVDVSGNSYITGAFGESVDFDPSVGIANLISTGTQDIFVAKYDAFGKYVFAHSIEGSSTFGQGYGIAIDGSANIHITGSEKLGIFIAGFDSSGNYLYTRPINSHGSGYAIAVDGSNNVYITGAFIDKADFDPGGGSANSILTSLNSGDIFIAKYGAYETLPIDLLSFNAMPIKGGSVQINWSTTSQINNAWFEVERSSKGAVFETIGRIKGCSNCTMLQEYELLDNKPLNGISYYRLKQVDLNKKFTYSPVVIVSIGAEVNTTMLVYPNITEGKINITVKNNQDEKTAVIQLITAAGILIKQQTVSLKKGDNTFNYNLSDQARGVYYISMSDRKNYKETRKVIRK